MTTKQVRLRKGTTVEHANFVGAIAEVTVDTTKKTLRVHDGATSGGSVLATEQFVNDVFGDTVNLINTITQGPQGIGGPAGPIGPAGSDGASAYEIAVNNGFQGTEQQWLASLRGQSGGNANTANTGFVDDRIYNINGSTLSNDDLVHGATARLSIPAYGSTEPVSLLNYYGDLTVTAGANPSSTVGWTFNNTGTLTTPLLFPRSFTAVLDENHMVDAIAFASEAPLWQFNVQFQVEQNGTIAVIMDNPFPILGNPGYMSGQTFRFSDADHGIPGYVFDITLNDVMLPGGAGWTANPAVTPAPAYPSTVKSLGAIKLTADANSWTFGTDGKLTLPLNGDIVDSTGQSVLGGGTSVSATAMLYTRTGTVDQQNNIGKFEIDNDDSFADTAEITIGVTDNSGYNFGSILNDFDLKDTQLKLTITAGSNYGVYLTNSYTPVTTSGYRGFKAAYSSVYGAYDPSINQLIFYSDQENPTITANTDTNEDDFTVSNIANSSTIGVVVLYGNGDGRISVSDLGAFFTGYVDMVLYDGETLRDAEGIQTAFYANSTSLFNLLPALFDNFSFTPGFGSNNVSDGNNDIYDGGNYIRTNLETGGIPYGDGSSVQDGTSYFGSGSTYVTLQTGSMFSMVAVNSSATQLGFGGDMGTDSGGHRSYGPLDTVYAYQIGLTHIKSSGTWQPVTSNYTIDYEIAGPIVKDFESQWTNPNSENTWGISTWQSGKRVNFVGRTYENQTTIPAQATHTNVNYIQFSDAGPNYDWINTNTNNLKTPHERLEVSVDGTTWYSATSGWGQGGGTIMVYIDQGQVSYNQDDPLYLRVAKGTVPEVWFNPSESPNGSGNFRGAIIEYHAYVENGGTIIGTIQIANDGNRNITHSEVTSGNNYNLQYSDLWVYDNFYHDGDGRIAFRTTNGEGTGFNIHWTAKMFYGNDYWD